MCMIDKVTRKGLLIRLWTGTLRFTTKEITYSDRFIFTNRLKTSSIVAGTSTVILSILIGWRSVVQGPGFDGPATGNSAPVIA